MSRLLSSRFWKKKLTAVMYFAAAVIVIHDVVVVVVQTCYPPFKEIAAPYILDKLLGGLLGTFGV